MASDNQLIKIDQFALKNVISLPSQASIGEAIRLMYKNGIRHIPILEGTDIIGVINPTTILDLFANDPFSINFDDNVSSILSENYQIVSRDFSLFEAVSIISDDPKHVIIIEESQTLIGIYTEIDILDSDFLWVNFNDCPVSGRSKLGEEITTHYSVQADQTIHHAIRLMLELDQDFIAVIEQNSNDLRGVLSFFEIIHHLYYRVYRQGNSIQKILQESIYNIFPSSGIYYIEPVLLSQVRRDMYVNDSFFVVIMDEGWHPKRIISIDNIVHLLIQSSDYFGIENDN